MKRVPSILFISSSIGLGHIIRDLAVAEELRKKCPDIALQWIATGPALMMLERKREILLLESAHYADMNKIAEKAAQGIRLNLFQYGNRAGKSWLRNIDLFKDILRHYHFDLVVADEAFEISYFFLTNKKVKKPPFVEILDFIGLEPMTGNPYERLKIYWFNRIWSKENKKKNPHYYSLFVGEPDDVPDERFGWLLPSQRDYAIRNCTFLGYILGFNPEDYANKEKLRRRLGYGAESLVLCSIGGTSIGRELLELCAESFPLLKERERDLQMVIVCGPQLSPDSFKVPDGVIVKGYIPKLHEHFAACDLAVVQGGGVSTLELTALKKPFIYFPLEKHFEQQHLIPERLQRHGAGVQMSYSSTTPETLTARIIEYLGKEVNYPAIPSDGALKAAAYIIEVLEK